MKENFIVQKGLELTNENVLLEEEWCVYFGLIT